MSYEQTVELTFEHDDPKVLEKLLPVIETWAASAYIEGNHLRADADGSWIIDEHSRLAVWREDAPAIHDALATVGVTLHKTDDDHFYFTVEEITTAVPGLSVLMEYIGEEFMDAERLLVKDGKVVRKETLAWVAEG